MRHVRKKMEMHYRTIHGVLDDVVEQWSLNSKLVLNQKIRRRLKLKVPKINSTNGS